MQTKLLPNGKYTIIRISEWMATTTKDEIEVIGVSAATVNDKTIARNIYKSKGKRKQYLLDLSRECIALPGWDLPVKVDTEFYSFSGNACFNLVGSSMAEVKYWIETKAVLPLTDQIKGKITFTPVEFFRQNRMSLFDEQELMYPEIDCYHAVVTRIKERMAKKVAGA